MILFGEGAVRKATVEFITHYHSERNHQGLDNALICRRERLGGLLNYYCKAA